MPDTVSREEAVRLLEGATPGDWTAHVDDDEETCVIACSAGARAGSTWFARDRWTCGYSDQIPANALLMVAAPRLATTVIAQADELAVLRARVAELEAEATLREADRVAAHHILSEAGLLSGPGVAPDASMVDMAQDAADTYDDNVSDPIATQRVRAEEAEAQVEPMRAVLLALADGWRRSGNFDLPTEIVQEALGLDRVVSFAAVHDAAIAAVRKLAGVAS